MVKGGVIMEVLRKLDEVQTHHGIPHEVVLKDGSTVTISRRTRKRIADGTVEHKPRIALHSEQTRGNDHKNLDAIHVGVDSEIQGLAALERGQVDMAVVNNMGILEPLKDQFVILSIENNEMGEPISAIVTRPIQSA